jgi:hypothetical protein
MSPSSVNTLTVSQLNGLSVGQVSALLNSPNSGSFSSSIKTSLISISQNQPIMTSTTTTSTTTSTSTTSTTSTSTTSTTTLSTTTSKSTTSTTSTSTSTTTSTTSTSTSTITSTTSTSTSTSTSTNTTYYNGVSFSYSQSYGTVSETNFNEESFLRSNPNYYVYAINVRCGDWIDGIQLQFQNSITNNIITDSLYGGSGGDLQTFYVPAGQFITSIYICYGTYVYQLLFTTNLGTQSPYYGSYPGTCTTVYFGRPGLLGIAGYYGQYLDLLQFIS